MTPTPSDMPHQVMKSVRDEWNNDFTDTYGCAIGDVAEIHAHMLAFTDDEQAAATLTLAVIMATPEDE